MDGNNLGGGGQRKYGRYNEGGKANMGGRWSLHDLARGKEKKKKKKKPQKKKKKKKKKKQDRVGEHHRYKNVLIELVFESVRRKKMYPGTLKRIGWLWGRKDVLGKITY